MPVSTVDAIALTDIPLDGTITQVDTFTLVPGTSKVAVIGQNNAAENYVYNVPLTGPWTRDTTTFPASSATFPNEFAVKEGSMANRGSRWQFDNRTTPTLGTTGVDIVQIAHPRALRPGSDISYDANAQTFDLAGKGIAPGTYERATFNERGIATAVFASGSGSTELEGLRVTYDGAAALTVGAGSAWVPGAGGGSGALVNVATDLSLTGLVLTAATTYYVYLYEAEGVGAAEVSLQRPASPYISQARVKGGGIGGALNNTNPDEQPDNAKRYLCSLRTAAANTILRFDKRGNVLLYQANTGAAPFRVASDVRQDVFANVDCSAVVPPTSRRAWVRISHEAGFNLDISNSGVSGSIWQTPARVVMFHTFVELDSLQRFQYRFSTSPGAGNGLTVDVLGYVEEIA